MKLSIILCTYNYASSLGRTLNEINQCLIPPDCDVELLCVDNKSSDNTRQVVNAACKHSSFSFQYLYEENQGLSYARNLGLAAATGDYILFTDDDAQINSGWIVNYCNSIQHEQPDCLYSQIFIIWDKPKPWWYLKEYAPFFVHLDYGAESTLIADYQHEFFGKNFCIRRALLNEFGGFDPRLGRCGDKLIAGEETLIYKRLIAGNYKVMYFPSATVGHRLKAREYELENMKKMYSDSAYSLFHISKMTATKKILGRPIYPLKLSILQLPLHIMALLGYALVGRRARMVYHYFLAIKYFKVIWLWLLNP